MWLKQLSLQHFRNYATKKIEFSPETTVIVGPNAVGKTSIIEAAYFLASGNSFRAQKIEEMIRFDQDLARIRGLVKSSVENSANLAKLDEIELAVMLTKGTLQGKRTLKTHYFVNHNRRRKKDFVGNLLAAAFRPEDLRLIEGSPSRRRQFLDHPLSSAVNGYVQSLKTYQKTLTKRNKLLEAIREGEQPGSVLTYWNLALLKHGEIIQENRRQLAEYFNRVEFILPFIMEYRPSLISEARLKQYRGKEIAAGFTLIGPHKDDFEVIIKLAGRDRELSLFGSRGQQRLGVLWLKTAELEFLQAKTEQKPILLLDDIFSELDEQSRERVMGLLDHNQTILTTTNPAIYKDLKQTLDEVKKIELSF